MARNDGLDRTMARNRDLNPGSIKNAQAHNEREKETYANPDIVPEESCRNVHFKQPSGSYKEIFDRLEKEKVISTRGLKEDATTYCELLFDVNSAYFHNQAEAAQAYIRMKELAPAVKNMEKLAREFSDAPEQILPEAGALESAKGYREKKAKPLLERIVKVLRSVYHAFLNLRNDYDRLQQRLSRECAKTARMGDRIDELADENRLLRGIAADFDRAKKALGKDKVETAVESVKQGEAKVQAERKGKRQYVR